MLAAREALADPSGDAIVLYADTPLITAATVARVFEALEGGASVAVLGFEPDDPAAYGRLITNAAGDLDRIVEFKDASEAERAVGLVNSGVLAAPAELLFDLLGEVGNDNANGEYYLTDVVGLARAAICAPPWWWPMPMRCWASIPAPTWPRPRRPSSRACASR